MWDNLRKNDPVDVDPDHRDPARRQPACPVLAAAGTFPNVTLRERLTTVPSPTMLAIKRPGDASNRLPSAGAWAGFLR